MDKMDALLTRLADSGIAAYVMNCEVGAIEGIPATFNYRFYAGLLWLKAKHMSRRERTTAYGLSAYDALVRAVEVASSEGMVGYSDVVSSEPSNTQKKSKEIPENTSIAANPQLKVISEVADLPEEPSETAALLGRVCPECKRSFELCDCPL